MVPIGKKTLLFSSVLAPTTTSCASRMKLSTWFQLFRTMSTNVRPLCRRGFTFVLVCVEGKPFVGFPDPCLRDEVEQLRGAMLGAERAVRLPWPAVAPRHS